MVREAVNKKVSKRGKRKSYKEYRVLEEKVVRKISCKEERMLEDKEGRKRSCKKRGCKRRR